MLADSIVVELGVAGQLGHVHRPGGLEDVAEDAKARWVPKRPGLGLDVVWDRADGRSKRRHVHNKVPLRVPKSA